MVCLGAGFDTSFFVFAQEVFHSCFIMSQDNGSFRDCYLM